MRYWYITSDARDAHTFDNLSDIATVALHIGAWPTMKGLELKAKVNAVKDGFILAVQRNEERGWQFAATKP